MTNRISQFLSSSGYIILFSIMLACSSAPSLPEDQYLLWINNIENEAIKIQETQQLQITCQYLPADYIVARELNNGILQEEEAEERRKELNKTHHFKLTYRYKDGTSIIEGSKISKEQEKQREEYLRSKAEKDIRLITSAENLPSISHLVRNYGIKPETELLLGFKKEKETLTQLTIEYNNQLIDTQKIVFHFDLDKIAQLDKYEK